MNEVRQRDLCAGPSTTVREAMAIITNTHQGLLPVLEDDGRLTGIVTDGDIRRGLLANLGLDQQLASIVNREPVVGRVEDEEHEIQTLMRLNNKVCVPIVDHQGHYIRLAYFNRQPIPNCVPSLEGREQAYAAEAIANGWLAIGPSIQRFERSMAEFTGAKHAVAIVNGTAALHLALLAVGVRQDDLVLLPTLTFVATANAVRYCGADPVFFDVEPECWGIDVKQIIHFLDHQCIETSGQVWEKQSGRRVGAILPVHLYGHPVDMDPLIEVARRYNIPIVEDGAEALGAKYKNRRVGSLTKLCCLSFNGNKIITGGNGGMVLTDDETLAKRIRYLSAQAKDDPVEFVHGTVGYNYRMPNINAAVALAQSEKLEEWVARKRGFVAEYEKRFTDIDGISMWREAQWAESSCWMAILTVDEGRYPGAVQRLRQALPEQGIEARPVWLPLHRQTPFSNSKPKTLNVAERIYRTSLCLPCSTGLTPAQLDIVANAIVGFFKNGN